MQVVNEATFPEELEQRIVTGLAPWLDKRLAVRSSCVVEDSKSTSFAGQYVSVLDVEGRDAVFAAIRRCWASQYDGRALNYAIARRGIAARADSRNVMPSVWMRSTAAKSTPFSRKK